MYTHIDGIALRLPELPALRKRLLTIPKIPGVPLYVYDAGEVKKNVEDFRNAFKNEDVPLRTFYAMKSNGYHGVLTTLVEEKCGIDVSSTKELAAALAAGADSLIYTGPAKTEQDCEAILKCDKEITVNLESIRELRLLSDMAEKKKRIVRCGIRVQTGHQTGWTKFGIPLAELSAFLKEAEAHKSIHLCGIHFHISMNETPKDYTDAMEAVATYAEHYLSPEQRAALEFLDIGGGFFPPSFDGIPTWNPQQHMNFTAQEEHLEQIFANAYPKRYIPMEGIPIAEYAADIAAVFRSHITPLFPNAMLYAEPGRFICHSAMHLLLTLVDIKDATRGIADAGNNMVGWEKYQYFNYTPVFNLTHFSVDQEIPFLLYGSLCTPDDVWGYYLYCSEIQEGDTLVLPYQGAYTHTLSQEFIRGVPNVVHLG